MRRTALLASLIAYLGGATAGFALEKNSQPIPTNREETDWRQGATCTTSYFNTCTGWLWTWSGWAAGDVLGMVYDPCCVDSPVLTSTSTYVWTGASTGYGFTGTIEVSTADGAGCPTAQLAQQAFLPVSGPNVHVWNLAVTGPVVLSMTLASSMALPQPVVIASDHPAVGPTGPAAWGFCYPTTRVIHSYYYGNTGTTLLCPGSSLFDGVGTAEWLDWFATFECTSAVEESSWAQIKGLYR
ncbi:MAG: hypothetical protein DHS20C21_12940 [Gemmatimonadota bacterium]|nr:MAG: hypothetical protein DHS20C21_12940 [Gemmatimonadota bacterium]